MKYIILLKSQELYDPALTGKKWDNLVKLTELGLNVPDGFCVTSCLYREHFRKSCMNEMEIVEKISSFPGEKRHILGNIRDKIISLPLNETLKEEIEKHFHLLGSNSVAVRSSSTAEDLENISFAGQYDTFLGISTVEDCILSIKKCWASLWNERVFDYREKYKVSHIEVSMAVIVQTLIEPDFSGVLFTADPVKRQKNRIVIEYCHGPGETLVSGKITPARIFLDKQNLNILDKQNLNILDKILDKQNLNMLEETKGELREEILKKLVKNSLKIEDFFACPQDIEWAIKNEEIFFLQSRPVTTCLSKEDNFTGRSNRTNPGPLYKFEKDNFIWTNANTGEVLPDVATPVTWSLAKLFIKEIFRQILTLTGIELEKTEIIKLIAGRIYFNLNVVTGIFKSVPAFKNTDFRDILGGMQGKKIEGLPDILPEDTVTFKINPWKLLFKVPAIFLWFLLNPPTKGAYFIDKLRKDTDLLMEKSFSTMTDEELFEDFYKIIEKFYDLAKLVSCAGNGMSYFNILKNICRLWLSDRDSSISNRLMSGMGNMESAISGLDLWRLSLSAGNCKEVKNIIMSEHNFEEIRKSLENIPQGKEFLSKWNDFMKRHGHHTRGEIELFNRRWAEDPGYILEKIKDFILQSIQRENFNPVKDYEKLVRERTILIENIRKNFKNPFKKYIFDHVLLQASSGLVFRENIKSEAVKRIFLCRLILLETGQRLVKKGILEKKEDIFFLELQEIINLFKTLSKKEGIEKKDLFKTLSKKENIEKKSEGNPNDVKKIISERRYEYEKNLTINPPPVIKGIFDCENFISEDIKSLSETGNSTFYRNCLNICKETFQTGSKDRENMFSGIAVSPGIVTGPARVILKSEREEKILPGEILVAPFTDPGWTPYFMSASAIVMDMGGMLSHGSIVARELAIPAVVNVGPATEIIKTGQMIRVDGNRGTVEILKFRP